MPPAADPSAPQRSLSAKGQRCNAALPPAVNLPGKVASWGKQPLKCSAGLWPLLSLGVLSRLMAADRQHGGKTKDCQWHSRLSHQQWTVPWSEHSCWHAHVLCRTSA